MTIQLEAAQALAVVERARSLFGTPGPVATSGAPLQTAAESVSGAGQQMSGLSGQLVDRHASVVQQQNRELVTAGRTDSTLEARLASAAQITEGGARQMDTIVAQTRSIAEVAGSARTPAAEMMVLKALRTQVARAQSVVASTQQQSSQAAGEVRALSYGSGELPQAPADLPTDKPGEDPPHGEDPRYWLDVTKLTYVGDGELAPPNYKQVGPNLWYPDPEGGLGYVPPPPPAKYPLDLSDVQVIDPDSGALFPPGYQQVAPGIGVPHPDSYYGVQPPWPKPQQPIDVRDVVEIAPDQLAPWGYVEYMPGWWVPDPSRP